MLLSNVARIVLSCAMLMGAQEHAPQAAQTERHSQDDLEVTGIDKASPPAQAEYVSKALLATLPQVQARVKADEDFPELPKEGVRISGVDLDALSQKLGGEREATIVAICKDGYVVALPPEYRRAHHPILVTTIEGLSLEEWAAKGHQASLGPYFIAYRGFVPAFKVLSHQDRRQVPTQVIRLEYTTADKLFAPIRPEGTFAPDSAVMQGYQIAQQNCFRCHASGDSGGRKSQKYWQSIAYMAKTEPDAFAAWVHNPQAVIPEAKMPPNPEYDRATLTALTKYFATLSPD